jgi:hypothetical protein
MLYKYKSIMSYQHKCFALRYSGKQVFCSGSEFQIHGYENAGDRSSHKNKVWQDRTQYLAVSLKI